ncbi:MAG: S-methyl-5-thioribose-1-phosphate isomerase [Deltaproteobacteria bacterium]|nr:S-methyl-5-thioribose-1-phosphate isomerase [Deltaproteobacteria bacterium]
MNVGGRPFRTVWLEDGCVRMIEQNLLPFRFEIVRMSTWHDTAKAIRDMTVRGAGAIGAAGALGLAQAALQAPDRGFHEAVAQAADGLTRTRPTAQNLFYGVGRVLRAIQAEGDDLRAARRAAEAVGREVADDDAECCRLIGEHGLVLVPDGARVSTHCNAGWLAFVDWGSALSPVYAARRVGRNVHVWVDETRPRGQGARLTAWELGQEGVPHAILPDGATASLMRRGQVDVVIVGSDRIAANGDVANKIGTYASALAARAHGLPFYVAAPTTTIDPGCPEGGAIPIEERSADEVRTVWGWSDEGRFVQVRVAPEGSPAWNPAFDVTPAELIAGIVTERGVVPATPEGIARVARVR